MERKFNKMEKKTQLKKSGPAKPAYKAGARNKSGASTVAAVAKRFGITAREARDIATAVGTAAKFRNNVHTGTYAQLKKDVGTQIKEVGKAAVTGKKGTKPARWKNGTLYDSMNPKRK